MTRVHVHERSCRGCRLCVELCPTGVFLHDDAHARATVGVESDCIGCLSCAYACPSGAIRHEDIPVVKNFYRDIEACARLQRYL